MGADVVNIVANLEVEMQVGVAAYEGATYLGLGVAAVGDGFQTALGCLSGEDVIVGIDESGAPFGGEVAVKFCFSLDNTLKAAKAFEVGTAHVGD